jgi:integrase/recombinase XerC
MGTTPVPVYPGGGGGPPAGPRVRLAETFLAGRSPQTFRAYRQDLEDFRAFVGAGDPDGAAGLLGGRSHGEGNGPALAYKADLVGRDLAAATVNRRLAALRSLVKLARTLGLVPWTLEVANMGDEPHRDTRGPGRDGVLCLLEELDRRADGAADPDPRGRRSSGDSAAWPDTRRTSSSTPKTRTS